MQDKISDDEFKIIVFDIMEKAVEACKENGPLVVRALAAAVAYIAEHTTDPQKAYEHAHKILDDGQEYMNLSRNAISRD